MKLKIEFQDKKGLNQIDENNKNNTDIQDANKVIELMKNNIGERFPVMYAAIQAMKFVPVKEDILLETDGIHIFYSPKRIKKIFKNKQMKTLEYAYVHIIVHGLLRHYSMAYEYENSVIMHILMDYEVRKFLNKLNLIDNNCASNSINILNIALSSFENMSLIKAYEKIMNDRNFKTKVMSAKNDLWIDDYKVWTRNRKFHTSVDIDNFDKTTPNSTNNINNSISFWSNMSAFMFKRGSSRKEDIIKNLINDNKNYGMDLCNDTQEVKAKDKALYDYRSVLKNFFKVKELSKENIESIDKTMYALGLMMYEDILFVEPESESEKQTLDTVVLAIDTSGSCMGEVLEQFLAETKALFSQMSQNNFLQLIVIQCDNTIQKIDTYKNVKQLPKVSDFESGCIMSGFGGTSFVPVFDYIEQYKSDGNKVDCLIYLSDAMGEFPKYEPEGYKTFFVLDKNTYEYKPIVPEWVSILKLGDDDKNGGIL